MELRDGSLPFFTPVYFSSRDRPKFFRWSLVKPDGIPVTGVNHVNPIFLFLCVYFLFKYIYIYTYLNIYIIYIIYIYTLCSSSITHLKTGKVGQSSPWLEAGTNSLAGQIWSDAHLVPAGILLDVRCTLRCQGSNALQMNCDGSGCETAFFWLKNFGGIWIVGGIFFLDST